MIKRLALNRIRPRTYRVTEAHWLPKGWDYRYLGLVLLAGSIGLLLWMEVDFGRDPLVALAILLVGALGLAMFWRSPQRFQVRTLLEVDLSQGVLITPLKSTNGSGQRRREIDVKEVYELLFAMRNVPLNESNPRSATVDAFAVAIRLADGELIGVVDACLDQDSTFRVARNLASLLNVGVKQVGKGWKAS